MQYNSDKFAVEIPWNIEITPFKMRGEWVEYFLG